MRFTKYTSNDPLFKEDSYLTDHFYKISRKGVSHNNYHKQVAWRREKVRMYLSRIYTQAMISTKLQISQSTISRDISIIQNKRVNKVRATVKDIDGIILY